MPIGLGFELEVSWRKPELIGDSPTPRSGHTLTILDASPDAATRKALLFGGLTGDAELTNEAHVLEFTEEPYEWTPVECQDGAAPPARQKHTATLIGDGRVLVFGGRGGKQSMAMSDCWIFDAAEMCWEPIGQ